MGRGGTASVKALQLFAQRAPCGTASSSVYSNQMTVAHGIGSMVTRLCSTKVFPRLTQRFTWARKYRNQVPALAQGLNAKAVEGRAVLAVTCRLQHCRERNRPDLRSSSTVGRGASAPPYCEPLCLSGSICKAALPLASRRGLNRASASRARLRKSRSALRYSALRSSPVCVAPVRLLLREPSDGRVHARPLLHELRNLCSESPDVDVEPESTRPAPEPPLPSWR